MRQKKATRASKRRARKKPEKGFKGLVNRIIRALRRNNTLTVISIVATVLVAAIPFGYTLLKDKKSIKVYIGDFEIKDDAYLALIYLYRKRLSKYIFYSSFSLLTFATKNNIL